MVKHLRGDIPIECSQCGHKFNKSLRSLEANPQFPCPNGCGLTVDGRPLMEEVRKAEKNIDKFGRKMSNLFKRR